MGIAARSLAQQQYDVPIFTGAISASDVMRSGFAFASFTAAGLVAEAEAAESGEDMEFSWGDKIAEVGAWAQSIAATPTPELRPAKRTKKSTNGVDSSSPATGTCFYGVTRGFEVKVVDNIAEARRLTDGFAGARYKRFRTFDAAQIYVISCIPLNLHDLIRSIIIITC